MNHKGRLALVLIVFISLFLSGKAQGMMEDSVVAKLATFPSDTAKFDYLIAISWPRSFSDPYTGMRIAREAENIARKIKDKKRTAKSLIIIGSIYRLQAAYDLAMEAFMESMQLAKEVNHGGGIASAYNNIATIQSQQKQYPEAVESFKIAHKLLKENGFKSLAPIPLMNIASTYLETDRLEEARVAFDSVVVELEEFNDERGLSATFNNMGSLYDRLKDYPKSTEYFNRSLALKQKLDDKIGISDVLQNHAVSLLDRGEYDKAYPMLRESLKYAQEVGANLQIMGCYNSLARHAELTGNIQAALTYQKQYSSLRDSVEDTDQNEKLAKMQTFFGMQQKDAEITLLNKDNEIQETTLKNQQKFNLLLIAGLALLMLILILLLWNNQSRKKANSLLKSKKLQIEKQQTEILVRNEELTRKNERLEDLNREMNGILHVVAHDLKAPLNRTSGLAHLVEISGPLTDEQSLYIKLIEKVNLDAGRLIKDLLDLHKIEQPETMLEFSEFDLTKLLQESVNSFEGEARKKNIEIKLETPESASIVRSDPNYLMRMLDNLISNAIKFSPQEKTVRVKAVRDNGTFSISVMDQGPGISDADQKKMFKKFQRLSAQPTGGESSTGLGLAIVKTLVEKLKGEVQLESKQGEGAAFTLHIPEKRD